jgi:pilus assembly protein CpaF
MDNPRDTLVLNEIKSFVQENVDIQREYTDEEIEDLVANAVFNKYKDEYLSLVEKRELIKTVFNSLRRLDVIQPLIEDKTINEIMVNGHKNIFIERHGKVEKLNLSFENEEKLLNVIQNIVYKVNRVVNEASPIVDARLDDGSRVNVVLPPLALDGPVLTIRKFPQKPMVMADLIKMKSITDEAAIMLEKMVKAKYNIFVSGGTGAGKTTFLNVLSNFIPKDERIITIEDSAELQILNVENLVRLETRNTNFEGKGEVTIRDLIKTSLRMRPERIVVGEVRGSEALDMLQAMNTGHDGSISTGHANSSKDMLSRLETMVLSAASIPLDAIRKNIASSIDVLVHLSRLRDKTRRVTEIVEILDYQKGEIRLNPLFVFEGGKLVRTKNEVVKTSKFEMAGIEV